MLDAVDSAATDINRAVAALPSAIADIQAGINQAGGLLAQGNVPRANELGAARDAAVAAVSNAQNAGAADPLGAFTHLTKADAELDRLLATITEEREATERLSRTFDQALLTAQSRVRSVSDYIDTRRGSIGPEARTRLSEAVRQLEAAQVKRATNLSEAIAHANGASMLADQAQTMANADVSNAQRSFTGGGGYGRWRRQHGRGARRHHHRQHPVRRAARRHRWQRRRRRLEFDDLRRLGRRRLQRRWRAVLARPFPRAVRKRLISESTENGVSTDPCDARRN